MCRIWLRGQHFSPSLPFREDGRYLKAAKGQPTAPTSDCTGRNPWMTRLVPGAGAMSRGTAFLSLVQTFRQRMRKCCGSLIRTIPKKDAGFHKKLTLS